MISFVVPAYNEQLLLGDTLEAIHRAAKLTGRSYEIIVVDDDSSDATSEIAGTFHAEVLHVRNRQIAATRNAGARIARGDWLVFVDADTMVSDKVLNEAIDALEEGAVGGGAAFTFDGRIPFWGKVLQFLVYRLYRWGGIASGAFLFCTKEAFSQVGGFDETLYGSEEAAMCDSLKKCGPFVVLKQTVLTSGRKLRLYSFWEIFGTIARVALSGGRITNQKAGRLWYDGKRE